MISQDYKNFINEKIMEYLPSNRIKTGDEVVFRCMFCGDSKKSATKKRAHYSFSKCMFHCFNCDASMNGIKLLKAISGQDFDDIKTEYLRMKVRNGDMRSFSNIAEDIHCSKSILKNLHRILNPEWKKPLTQKALDYLNKRKVLDAPFLKEKLYSVFDKDKNEYILIPWIINGIEAYYQVNDFQKIDKFGRKYIFPKNDKLIYGLDNIDLSFPYIICFEGVYDSLFVKNGICVGGKTLSELQYNILKERYPRHEIVLAFDNDDPGLKSIAKKIKTKPTEFKYFKWFDRNTKEKDINDFILAKNDVSVFADRNKVEKMIVDPVIMKMFLLEKNLWN